MVLLIIITLFKTYVKLLNNNYLLTTVKFNFKLKVFNGYIKVINGIYIYTFIFLTV